jgi:glycosyltransferase involved in cell wall biosynthesis
MKDQLRSFARARIPPFVRRQLWTVRRKVWVARLVVLRKVNTIRRKVSTARSVWRTPNPKLILRPFLIAYRNVIRTITTASLLVWISNKLSNFALFYAIRLGPKLSASRLARGRPRSLWGVTPILTLALKARADRQLGFRSRSLVYVTYVTTSQFDINLRKSYVVAYGLGLLPAFQRFVLAWALMRYDVFHCFADWGLLDSRSRLQINTEELAAWRAAGKRLYVYAYGADVRTRDKTLALGRWNFCVDCTEPPKYCICVDSAGEENVSQIAKHATAMVSLGDMLVYMPGAKHLNYWPIDIDRIKPGRPVRVDGPLRIGHAPNHTHFKGSVYLEQVISRLQAGGHLVEYVKIQGVPNTQVIELFESCDLVADQFIGGAYGYTALEAMALGRPVLSFVRSRDLLDAPDECPIINTTPDTLEEVLTWVLNNRAQLAAIGEQGKSYVRRWHSIGAVALRLGQLYRDTADFPDVVLQKIAKQHEKELRRRNAIPVVTGWEHPYQVGCEPGLENEVPGAGTGTMSISKGAMGGRPTL